MVIILQLKGNEEEKRDLYANGIDRRNTKVMAKALFENIDKNMRKKVKSFTDDQWIEVLEVSFEMQQLNTDLGKKIIIRDLIRNKIAGLAISDKFKAVDQQVEQMVPKLICVLMETFSDMKFVQSLLQFNTMNSQMKVTYSIQDLFS